MGIACKEHCLFFFVLFIVKSNKSVFFFTVEVYCRVTTEEDVFGASEMSQT